MKKTETNTKQKTPPHRIIKKYNNRRLYDMKQRGYINLSELKELVLEGERFSVINATDGNDITSIVLAQLLLNEEMFGVPVFSEESLRNLIIACSGPMRGSMAALFEQMVPMMKVFQEQINSTMGPKSDQGYVMFEDMLTQNGETMRKFFEAYIGSSLINYFNMGQQMRNFQQGARGVMGLPPFANPWADTLQETMKMFMPPTTNKDKK